MGDEDGARRAKSRLRLRLSTVLSSARRMVAHPGSERETALLVVKSAVAATLAWFVAHTLLQAPSSTFAPFSAVLIVHATVYRSVEHALRFGLAMVGGVALAGIFTPMLGSGVPTFAAIVLLALFIGQWKKLGYQGVQVSVAAMFAYYSFVASDSGFSSWMQLVSIAGLVLMGCAIGVVVNLVIVPPLRYRGAEYSAQALTQSVRDVLQDIAEGVREGTPRPEQAESWWNRADELPGMARQVRDQIDDATESMRFNPRRWFRRRGHGFRGYTIAVNTMQRVSEQLDSITRSLVASARSSEAERFHEIVLSPYADVVEAACACIDVLGSIQDDQDLHRLTELEEGIERGRRASQHVADQAHHHDFTQPSSGPSYESLYADARRLMEEFSRAHSELDRLRSTTPQ